MVTIKSFVIVAFVATIATAIGPSLIAITNVAEAKNIEFTTDARVAMSTKAISNELTEAKKTTEIALEKKRKQQEEEKRVAEEKAKLRSKVASYSPTNYPSSKDASDGWMLFRSTAYSCQAASEGCSPSRRTATGTNPVAWKTVAVDPRVIPLGSMVEIKGVGIFRAEDTGGAIKGNILDVYTGDYQQALAWGRRSIEVRIVQ